MLFGKRRRAAQARERQSTRETFVARGWRWEDAAPPPDMEISEAAMRARRGHRAIWPTGMSEVASGTAHGYAATAARLVGYEFTTTNTGTPLGRRVETNLVWLRLPQSLPEIRFGDATLPDRADAGVRLPPLDRSPAGPSERWSVEGFIPDFARDLLTPGFVAALETAPERTPVVIRDGVILTYGAESLDVAAVDARLDLLATLLGRVPADAWGRADALVAGTGVSPHMASDGPALRLDERIVERDWKGFGLQKVDWRETPTAQTAVVLKHREAMDVWPTTPDDAPGLSIDLQVGGIAITRPKKR
ncbi:hypothetical protein [Agromyces atrinae]|uniref:Uncharacterized protein n=1 Tax=Agromyces atrinae TaxID=592376 RepID=A0A4Q2M723_9MICO|nr:hypothetical protein [Agromyces atrinae]NYD67792.1 hypothetical protein [Agromyces atrinae]RXZ88024.1 hypothetical protein ESP50_02210 [Agromyces atrinae]